MKVNKQLVRFSLSASVFKLFFIYGCTGSLLLQGLSPGAASRGSSPLHRSGSSFQWLLLWQSTGSRYGSSSGCNTGARKSWVTGWDAPQHLGSSWTKDRTHAPCTGRWALNHYTPEKSQPLLFILLFIVTVMKIESIFILFYTGLRNISARLQIKTERQDTWPGCNYSTFQIQEEGQGGQ